MLKNSYIIIITIFLFSCTPNKDEPIQINKIVRVLEQSSDSTHIFKKYVLQDSTIVSKHTYPKSPINKFIGGTFSIKYAKDTMEKSTYTALSNDSIFYKVESYCKNEDRLFIRHGDDIVFMEQIVEDSISIHNLYIVNPYFFDSLTVSTFSYAGDSIKYNTKDFHLKQCRFSIQNKDTTDLYLVINQFPINCNHNFTDTILLKSKLLLTPK